MNVFNGPFVIGTLFAITSFCSSNPKPDDMYKESVGKLKDLVKGPQKDVFNKAVAFAADPLFYPMLKKLKSPKALKAYREILNDLIKYVIMKEGTAVDPRILKASKDFEELTDDKIALLVACAPLYLIETKIICEKDKNVQEFKQDELASDLLKALEMALKENEAELTEEEKKLVKRYLQDCGSTENKDKRSNNENENSADKTESNFLTYVAIASVVIFVLLGSGVVLYLVLGRKTK